MPRLNAVRGEVWIVGLGMVAKVRPCLVLSIPTDPQDRVLMTVVPHTTSLQGARFEVAANAPFLPGGGAFDARQIITVPQVKLVRKLGTLVARELKRVEDAVKQWLGF
jgi:mRNA interferase MazF